MPCSTRWAAPCGLARRQIFKVPEVFKTPNL
jgi:hypothetical protein